ncbi:spore germination protein [Clostridium grantii]|uniref:GerA spore germination protein n=1 Tax=Clostridium grantii DSM 8605 TaxID=1121316 RepID=A0A1M5WWR0_9CLOT|nr:spore germination protein [Clostridium grantii]SHH92039.1 GerA spore germination protein [Clostridium grantii DSM 8605]
MKTNFDKNIDLIINEIGAKSIVNIKKILMGKNKDINAAIIFVSGLVNNDSIDRDVLTPLMFKVNEELILKESTAEYICKRYIPMSGTIVETDINKVIESIKSGKTAILIDGVESFIVADTVGGERRSITDSPSESAIRGPREGFVENIEVNISMIRRRIKDKNLEIETFKLGRRSQTDLALIYIEDIVDKDVLNEVRNRIMTIDVDLVDDTGVLEQYIEDSSYSIFPQIYGTERPDIINANLMEGRIAIILGGTPYVLTVPGIFVEFFQAVEDYNERMIISSFSRFLRIIAIFIIITLPSIYLALIQYNAELIPVKFINPIVQSRRGIALTPLFEVLAMEIVVEFLREGGLRLPPRIASTLSIVGGIIIGNTAIESKIVSPTTLLVVGISVIATFLIPSYEMSLSIRFIRFPMLIITSAMGFLGLTAGVFFLIIHLFSLESFGVPYICFKKSDMKDIFIRSTSWKMNKRPESIPNNNPIRQSDFRKQFRRNKNG